MTETAKPSTTSVIATAQEYRDRYAHVQPDVILASYGSGDLAVTNAANVAVNVANGSALVQAARYDLTAGPLVLPVAANGGGSNRFDIVCLTYDAGHVPVVYGRIVQGVAGAGLPALTNSRTGVWDFPLYHFEKQPGGNIINITDRRKFTDGKNGIVTGLVSGAYPPPAPYVGMEFTTSENVTWRWDGTNWVLSSWGPCVAKVKSGNQSVTNSTVLVDDTELQQAVLANAKYRFTLSVQAFGPTGNDLKWELAGPAGASVGVNAIGLQEAATGSGSDLTEAYNQALPITQTHGTLGAAVKSALYMTGYLSVSGTAGTFKFRFAQNVAGAGLSATVLALSALELQRVG